MFKSLKVLGYAVFLLACINETCEAQICVTGGITGSSFNEVAKHSLSWNAGLQYFLLAKDLPVVASSRLTLCSKVLDFNGEREIKDKVTLNSLHLAPAVGFRLSMKGKKYMLLPEVGAYLDYGLWGKAKVPGEMQKHPLYVDGRYVPVDTWVEGREYDPYKDYDERTEHSNNFDRLDYGLSVGLSAFISYHWYIYFAFEYGMKKLLKHDTFDTSTNCLVANLGYRF